MRAALIGYTGFVGSNLNKQYSFTDLYNSTNIQDMKGQVYGLVVCAGVSAVKWMANKAPKEDLENIKILEDVVATIKAKCFILISTIDVYAVTERKDESFDCSSIDNHAYGVHRLSFEKFCDDKFDNCIIVRLPGLFGDGLKKNVIYDLLNDNCLEAINYHSSFQYYYLKYLWKDIQIAIENDIKCLNLFTEPVSTKKIYQTFFSDKNIGQEPVAVSHYDLYTKYARNWNATGNYIYSEEEMMWQLSEFIEEYRKEQGEGT